MKQLKYNSNSNEIRFDIPEEWQSEDLTGCTIALHNEQGVELLASTAMTVYAATTLDSSATQFGNEITLVSGAAALNINDSIELQGASGREVRIVKGYDSTARTATLEANLNNDYDAGDAVRGLFLSYNLDTTDTDVFTVGLVCVATLTPAGTGATTKEEYQISKSRVDIINLRRRANMLYPRMYSAFTDPVDKFAFMVEEAELQLNEELSVNLIGYDRAVEQGAVSTLLLAKLQLLWLLNGDDDKEFEIQIAMGEFAKHKDTLLKNPLWLDNDQDGVKDAGEETTHEHFFERQW